MNIKLIITIALVISISGCATVRTRWSDKTFRTTIYAENVEIQHYSRILHALKSSKKFIIIDRNKGLEAIKKEQNLVHQEQSERFDNNEKFALWGKLYSVGSVIIPTANCSSRKTFWGTAYLHCVRNLQMVDTATGEIIATAEDEVDGEKNGDLTVSPPWKEIAESMILDIPETFEKDRSTAELKNFRKLATENAQKVESDNKIKALPAPVGAPATVDVVKEEEGE